MLHHDLYDLYDLLTKLNAAKKDSITNIFVQPLTEFEYMLSMYKFDTLTNS